jgi:hypothetical protein
MCKKQQMGWSRAGAQYLLYVKTAAINGRLERYTRAHSTPADIVACIVTIGSPKLPGLSLRTWPSILSSLVISPRKKHAPKDYSTDQTKGSIICNLEKYAYLTVSRLSSSTSNRSVQPRPQGGKIDASSSAAKNIQIEMGSINPDRKVIALCFVGGKLSSGASSHHAIARWELVTLPILMDGSHSLSARPWK